PGCLINQHGWIDDVPVGDFLLGKVVDPLMQCLNDPKLAIPETCDRIAIDRTPLNPMERERITKPLSLGIRAIDGALTFGDGQRLGIMAGSGVGKSVLMGM